MGNKIIINGETIYLEDDSGKVVIDKRVMYALMDGNLDFIDDYNLNDFEKSKVIEYLNKYNKINTGLDYNTASKVAKIIKDEEASRQTEQIDINELKSDDDNIILNNELTSGQEDKVNILPENIENKENIYKQTLDKIKGDDKVHEGEEVNNDSIKEEIEKSYKDYLNKANVKSEIDKPKSKPIFNNPKPEPSFVKDVDSGNDIFFLEPRDKSNVVNDDLPVIDDEWITDVFMLSKEDLETVIKDAMFWTTAELKITDTSLGGNIGINNLPQFTRTADIRVMGKRNDREAVKIETISGNHGMGRYYSEKIDDNTVKCYLEFGVPEFNGVFDYLTSAVDYKSAVVANSGRSPLAYNTGHLIGSVAFFAAFPIASIVFWLGKEVMDLIVGPGNFEFYYLKETMPKYWSIVNSLVMMMATELGILLPSFNNKKNSNTLGAPLKLNSEDLEYFKLLMPDVITDNGEIDIFAVITRTQRAVNKYLEKQYSTIKTNSNLRNIQDLLKEAKNSTIPKPTPYHDYWKKVKKAYSGPLYGKKDDKNTDNSTPKKIDKISANKDGTFNKDSVNFIQNTKKWINNFIDATKANMYGGAEYAVFNVEYLGSSSMSVSNEVGELELQGLLKGVGGKVRAIKFSGGAGITGVLGDVMGYAMDTAVGALDGVTLNMTGKILTMLLGEANLNLPLRWMDSSISLPTHTFKMKLVSPYGNPMSQLINIYIPLASIMAGSLPLATGMSSYTSPFLCRMFVRGYQKINLGMITSLEINKGTTNLPYNKAWKPLGIDVSFTVTDFSKIMALPVGQDLTSMSNIIYDDNNPLNRFIQSLCGRDLKTSTFLVPKMNLRLSRVVDNITLMTKPDYLGMKVGDTLRWLGKMVPNHTELGGYNTLY